MIRERTWLLVPMTIVMFFIGGCASQEASTAGSLNVSNKASNKITKYSMIAIRVDAASELVSYVDSVKTELSSRLIQERLYPTIITINNGQSLADAHGLLLRIRLQRKESNSRKADVFATGALIDTRTRSRLGSFSMKAALQSSVAANLATLVVEYMKDVD